MARTLPKTQLTKDQFDDLVKDLRGNIYVLCLNIEALVEKNGKLYETAWAVLKETRYNVGIVTLYLHALEQVGKLIMVTDCKSTFDGTHYDLDSIKTDFYDHEKKLEKALEALPDEIKDIFVDSAPEELKIDERLRMLHSDIDSLGNVVYARLVDTDKVKKAFKTFKDKQFSY